MENFFAERRSDDDSGQHRSQENGPGASEQNEVRAYAQEGEAFAQFAHEAADGSFSGIEIMQQLGGARHHVASFADREVAQKRNNVGGDVDKQDAAKPDVLVDKAYDGASDEPTALYADHQKGVGTDVFGVGREFLDQRGDRGPEHPESSRDQHVHGVKMP